MPRMIELIRRSAVPANILRAAAHGSLSLPPLETIEVLVELSNHSVFGERARLTLAGWDEASSLAVVSDPDAPPAVLEYFAARQNLRPALLPALLENPSVPEVMLRELAMSAPRDVAETMAASPRVRNSSRILDALAHNPVLTPAQSADLHRRLEELGGTVLEEESDPLELKQYLREHAWEIADEEGKPFTLWAWTVEEQQEVAAAKSGGLTAPHAAGGAKGEAERESAVQRISKMTVGERVRLALKGNRDERFILIRDGARVVSNAVMESPKLNEQEVEAYASMRNVHESVLYSIAGKRKWIKHYAILRALTRNPRAPIDVVSPLIPRLLMLDLRNLVSNRDLSETVRKMATRLLQDRVKERGK